MGTKEEIVQQLDTRAQELPLVITEGQKEWVEEFGTNWGTVPPPPLALMVPSPFPPLIPNTYSPRHLDATNDPMGPLPPSCDGCYRMAVM